AEEEVFVGRGPEHTLEHVLAEQPPTRVCCIDGAADITGALLCRRSLAHARSMRSWRSAKARSRTSGGTPARSKSSSSCIRTSARSHGGQAANRSATVSGYGYPGNAASSLSALMAPSADSASAPV